MNRSVEARLPLADQLLRHAGWSRRLARSLLGDESLAEDAVQDAWVAAVRFSPRLDRPLAPWLRTVLRNGLFNRRRGENRRRAIESEVGAAEEASAPSPEELLDRLQTQKLLVEVVSELAEPYRQTVLLRYFEGRSSGEIAAQMRLPAATVRGRLRTALVELREALERRCGDRRAWMLALERLAPAPQLPGLEVPGLEVRAGLELPATSRPAIPAVAVSLRWILAVAVLAGAAAMVWTSRGAPGDGVSAGVDGVGGEGAAPVGSARAVVSRRPSFQNVRAELVAEEITLATPAGQSVAAAPTDLDVGTQTAAAADPPGATIVGTVKMLGPIPRSEAPDLSGDPFCARFAPGDAGDVVVREGRLASAVVRVTRGWTGRAPVPSEPVTLEQRGCRYHPRVLVARAGQRIAITNEDEIVHEVTARPGAPAETLAFRARALELRSGRPGEVMRLGCSTHGWMVAHVLVSESPFVAISDEEGRFRLTGLPPGSYRLEAWHERLGTRSQEVNLAAGATREVTFDFGEEGPRLAVVAPGRCGIAVEGKSSVALACLKYGIMGAKRVMKAMVAKGKKRGLQMECGDCHRNDNDWTLVGDERQRFETLVAANP